MLARAPNSASPALMNASADRPLSLAKMSLTRLVTVLMLNLTLGERAVGQFARAAGAALRAVDKCRIAPTWEAHALTCWTICRTTLGLKIASSS